MTLEQQHNDANLEQQLAALSAWPPTVPTPQLWKRVAPQDTSGWRSLIQRPFSGTFMGGLAAVLVLALAVGLILPSLSKARSSARVARSVSESQGWNVNTATAADLKRLEPHLQPVVGQAAVGFDPAQGQSHFYDREESERSLAVADLKYKRGESVDGLGGLPQIPVLDPPGKPASPDSLRQVIRKAMIEMVAKDVRTTFAKVPLILSEAQGEFVQESTMTADAREPDRVTATVVIRVAASRLSKVLGELRELGKVTTESAGGEDVTDQMVDLDARLRNEQRVEKELLALMDTRKDAPLKEIMELRASLDSVRQGIERMAAQRERIGRLVSLATVMVVIRTDKPEPPAPASKPEPTLGSKFTDAAKSGWANLVGTLTWLVEIAIGGLVWWLIVGLCVTLAWRAARRAVRRGAEESAPSA